VLHSFLKCDLIYKVRMIASLILARLSTKMFSRLDSESEKNQCQCSRLKMRKLLKIPRPFYVCRYVIAVLLSTVFIVQAYQTSQYVVSQGGIFLGKWRISFAGSSDDKMNVLSACAQNTRYMLFCSYLMLNFHV
jgi:hypothetical protein